MSEWIPGRKKPRKGTEEQTIGLWGPRQSGKTLFLLALLFALDSHEKIRAIVDPDVNAGWEDLLESFRKDGNLPQPSETTKIVNFEMSLERRRTYPLSPRAAKIIVPDHSGEVWNIRSHEAEALDKRPELVAQLQEANGMIFLIDPQAVFARPTAGGGDTDVDTAAVYDRPLKYIIRKMLLRNQKEIQAGRQVRASRVGAGGAVFPTHPFALLAPTALSG